MVIAMPPFGGTTLLSYVMAALTKFPADIWNFHLHPHLHLGQPPPPTSLLFVFLRRPLKSS